MQEMKRVVVTGATGALGTALIRNLIAQGIEVYAVCRPKSPRIDNLPQLSGMYIVERNLADIAHLSNDIGKPCEGFYHLAWAGTGSRANRFALPLQVQNIGYALDAVEAAHSLGAEFFVGAGSQAEYGLHDEILTPETATHPISGYGIAKLAAGDMTRLAAHSHGMRHIWPRILSIYGENDGENTLISFVIRSLLMRKRPQLTAGEQIWDYLSAKDAAEALYRMGMCGRDGAVYPLGSGKTRCLREFIQVICNKIDPDTEIGWGERSYLKDQVMHLEADISQLTEDTGWMPRIEFEEGIEEAIENIKRKLKMK